MQILIIGFIIFYIYLLKNGEIYKTTKEKYLDNLFLSRPFAVRTSHFGYDRQIPPIYAPQIIKHLYRRMEPILRNDVSLLSFSINGDYQIHYILRIKCVFLDSNGDFFHIEHQIDKCIFDRVMVEDGFIKSIIHNIIGAKQNHVFQLTTGLRR